MPLSLLAASYGPMTEQEASKYDQELNNAISKAEKAVEAAKTGATRHDLAPNWNSKLEMQNAVTQLEVKKTLVANFRGTESLESPIVRKLLLSVLNKSIITTADLAELQSTVLTEKDRLHKWKAEQAAANAQKS